jgi:hypothetical protein
VGWEWCFEDVCAWRRHEGRGRSLVLELGLRWVRVQLQLKVEQIGRHPYGRSWQVADSISRVVSREAVVGNRVCDRPSAIGFWKVAFGKARSSLAGVAGALVSHEGNRDTPDVVRNTIVLTLKLVHYLFDQRRLFFKKKN